MIGGRYLLRRQAMADQSLSTWVGTMYMRVRDVGPGPVQGMLLFFCSLVITSLVLRSTKYGVLCT
jgi:hypothetical protein